MESKTFTFTSLPKNVAELQAVPEASMSTPFATAALTAAVLCRYEDSPEDCIAMLDFLKGPQPMSAYDKQFLRDRLGDKLYLPRSYFEGSSPSNNYKPTEPFKITTFDNPYSYTDENYAVIYINSTGADSPRSVKCRKKASGDQWFLWENFLMSGIRVPAADDPWA